MYLEYTTKYLQHTNATFDWIHNAIIAVEYHFNKQILII